MIKVFQICSTRIFTFLRARHYLGCKSLTLSTWLPYHFIIVSFILKNFSNMIRIRCILVRHAAFSSHRSVFLVGFDGIETLVKFCIRLSTTPTPVQERERRKVFLNVNKIVSTFNQQSHETYF